MLSLCARRGLSTTSTLAQLVKTPIQVHGVEGRYATALYSAAVKQKELQKVDGELKALKAVYDKDLVLQEFIRDPTYKRSIKVAAMKQVLTKLGQSKTSINFFALVAQNGRLTKFDAILRSFETLMAAHRGEIVCEVVTAKPLDASMTSDVQKALQGFAKGGQTLKINYMVEPSLLGGMTVTIGDRFVDMSLGKKIQHYEQVMKEAMV